MRKTIYVKMMPESSTDNLKVASDTVFSVQEGRLIVKKDTNERQTGSLTQQKQNLQKD